VGINGLVGRSQPHSFDRCVQTGDNYGALGLVAPGLLETFRGFDDELDIQRLDEGLRAKLAALRQPSGG
jgi:hypothetical protein